MTIAASTPSTQILVSKMNQCLEKWLISVLEQGKYKVSVGRFMVLQNKELLEDQWGHIKKTWVWLEGDTRCLNLGQIEHLNIVGNGSYHIKIKKLNHSDNQKNK